ncbi:MAG TPA: DUF4148 domain-containing protein [Trinickia sp.]|jgi:hypothetical protein|nr:DUF4148 domain-containing protein [Trinickia sp.]
MKSLVIAVVAASALSAPLVSFAQQSSNQPVTRAQVRADLVRLEKAGYNPNAADPYYPQDIQAAERRVATEQVAAGNESGYGGVVSGSSRAGVPADAAPTNVDGVHPLFFGR